jgi:hypothetical protein
MGLVLKESMLHSNHYRRLAQQTAAFAPRPTISKVTPVNGQDAAKSTPTSIPQLMTSDQSRVIQRVQTEKIQPSTCTTSIPDASSEGTTRYQLQKRHEQCGICRARVPRRPNVADSVDKQILNESRAHATRTVTSQTPNANIKDI